MSVELAGGRTGSGACRCPQTERCTGTGPCLWRLGLEGACFHRHARFPVRLRASRHRRAAILVRLRPKSTDMARIRCVPAERRPPENGSRVCVAFNSAGASSPELLAGVCAGRRVGDFLAARPPRFKCHTNASLCLATEFRARHRATPGLCKRSLSKLAEFRARGYSQVAQTSGS